MTGKNAADIALVIDAKHMMRKGRLDGFCLVSVVRRVGCAPIGAINY